MGFKQGLMLNLVRPLGDGLSLFTSLSLIITVLLIFKGRKQAGPTRGRIYSASVLALTVGPCAVRPCTGQGKVPAIVIALFGLLTTEIIAEAATLTYARHYAGVG